MIPYLIIATFVLAYCMVANRLARTILTAPMVFLGFGALLSVAGLVPERAIEAALHLMAEIALVVILFLDAARIDQRALLRHRVWPLRMLAIGLPLGFLLGVALGWLLLPGWPLAVVALIAAILVPTDAALGQAVITNPDIAERPRRALTVESGLNDGLALPLVLMMAALAAPEATAPQNGWLAFALVQVTLGPLVGATIGFAAGKLLLFAQRTSATAEVHEGIGALAVIALTYCAAVQVGGNGFIAAFAGGLGFGAVVRGKSSFVYEFADSEGQLLSWAAFLLLGAVLVPDAVAHLTWPTFLVILGSLFVVRPVAIWVSLLGTDCAPETRLFFGWFGPRGLATALFVLLVVEQLDAGVGEQVLHVAVNAVWISAVLHGITAVPGARWYARRLAAMTDAHPEMQPVPSSHAAFEARET